MESFSETLNHMMLDRMRCSDETPLTVVYCNPVLEDQLTERSGWISTVETGAFLRHPVTFLRSAHNATE